MDGEEYFLGVELGEQSNMIPLRVSLQAATAGLLLSTLPQFVASWPSPAPCPFMC